MTTLPDETTLWTSTTGALTLTTHRLRYQIGTGGNMHLVAIMLEELASVGLIRTSNTVLLIFGVFAAVAGAVVAAANGTVEAFVAGLVLGGILITLYLATRQTLLAFQSAGGSIRIIAAGMKLPDILQLIEATEAAKNQRSLLLSGHKRA